MTRLEELEKAAGSLTEEGYRELRLWFLQRDWEQWEIQIEEDSKTGRLDFLIEEAIEAKKAGNLQDL